MLFGMFDIPVSSDQAGAFLSHFVQAGAIYNWAALAIGFFGGWTFRRSWDRDNVKHWKDLVDWYETKAGTFSNGEAIARLLTRMEALPEATLKDAEIVGEVREGLKGIRDSEKMFADSVSQPQAAPPTLNRRIAALINVLVSLLVLGVALIIVSGIETTYDQFPNPLSQTQMSDLIERLRAEGPQTVMIVRKVDPHSVALAEQFRKIFESAHWVLITPPRPPNKGVTLVRGLVVLHAPTDYRAFALSRALYISGLPCLTLPEIELTDSGYFELSVSDGWFSPPPL
jgi:hypothetical protein